MTTMVRKQIYIPRRQEILIKRLSQARGISEAEVIRQAIEREINRELIDIHPEKLSAWDQLMQAVEERKAEAQPGEPYRWNREEIYAERENRWLRQKED